MKLSIIIPLYNEENLVIEVLNRMTEVVFPAFVTSHEIIIVDDCSTDRSLENVKKFAAKKLNMKIISQPINRGKGAAVRTGVASAAGDVFVIQDADMELSPMDIPSMLHAMHELKVQFINGSRYLPGIARPLASYKRFLANRFFTFITSIVIDVKLTDMACAYKLVHKDLFNQLQLKEDRFGFEAELIIKALRIKRNNIAEVPVRYFPRNEGEGKKLRNMDAFRILGTILKYGLLGVK